MKSLIVLFILIISGISQLSAQNEFIKSENFTVYGNCGMCKKTIEKAASIKGVKSAVWNMETDVMTVRYDTTIVKLVEIKNAIASSGYDTDECRASDEAYKKLHGCCQYERPARIKTKSPKSK